MRQLRSYERRWLRGDILAGLTVAAYMIPQVMAYAEVAGLPLVVGLWASVPALLVYPLLGSSPQLSVGPESTTALLTASIVAPLAARDPDRYATLAATLAVVLGVWCIVGWLARLGFLADLLSRPVLVGYLAGLGVAMIVSQLGTITGVHTSGHRVVPQLVSWLRHLGDIQPASLAVGAATLVFLFAVPHIWPRVPGPLLAVVLATAAVAAFNLDQHGVAVVGSVARGLPHVSAPSLADVGAVLLPALGVLAVGYSDDVLTARSFGARNGYEIDANQEFLSLGVSNLGAGLVGTFPVSCSASRTALADLAAARSQLYSLVTLLAILGTLAFLLPVLSNLPLAALGAVVIYAAIRLIDIAEFRRMARFRGNELVLAVATTVAVVGIDLLWGVGIAIALSVIETLWRVARPHDAILGQVPGLAGMHDVDDYPEATEVPGLVVYRYDSPLFFANAEDFRRRALAAVEQHKEPVRWFLLNVEANVEVDITALDAMELLRSTLVKRGIVFALARVKQDLLADLAAYGLADSIGHDHLFPTLPTALAAYQKWCEEQAVSGG